jgi:hypothetical protein
MPVLCNGREHYSYTIRPSRDTIIQRTIILSTPYFQPRCHPRRVQPYLICCRLCPSNLTSSGIVVTSPPLSFPTASSFLCHACTSHVVVRTLHLPNFVIPDPTVVCPSTHRHLCHFCDPLTLLVVSRLPTLPCVYLAMPSLSLRLHHVHSDLTYSHSRFSSLIVIHPLVDCHSHQPVASLPHGHTCAIPISPIVIRTSLALLGQAIIPPPTHLSSITLSINSIWHTKSKLIYCFLRVHLSSTTIGLYFWVQVLLHELIIFTIELIIFSTLIKIYMEKKNLWKLFRSPNWVME